MDKSELLSELVEVSAKPIVQAKNYWHESIFNTLREKRKSSKDIEDYALELKADIVSVKKLWDEQMKVIENWALDEKIPEVDQISSTIENMENECKTAVLDKKVVFKNGNSLNKDELNYIERYNSIKNLNERIASMEEDYLYLRIRDYIVLNLYQFLAENREMALNVLKGDTDKKMRSISDLICKAADSCMYIDLEED
ncbi:hypothetical protein [Clostridium luticellarii]|nr:hypothetical protein [Clostridium luticellarii]MCI1943803.1 hypothetical protein [Clostridium luticellarii]MCI1967064.1 hypothetical protein [Clostridium luticellarii]MCI1994431.1 hypothetical protein [Clostridium luticellarii]MCI2038616.1 hypothetical protein [Clostridium luticellarii]